MNFDELPRFTQGLVLLNMALDVPARMVRRGGIEALFGLLLVPVTIILFFGLPLFGYVLRLALALGVISVRAVIGLFSQSMTQSANQSNQAIATISPAPTISAPSNIASMRGTITWFYSGGRCPEAFPVTRAVMHALGVLTIECDCGTPSRPYHYTIKTRSDDGINFYGSFRGGQSSRSRSEGRVTGIFQSTNEGCTLEGSWEEGGETSRWVAQLSSVSHQQ